MDISVFLESLARLINDVSFIPWAAALVLLLTQVVKRFVPQIAPAAVALALQVIVWVLYAIANHFGYGQNVQDIVTVVTNLVNALLPILPPMLLGAAVTKVAYDKLTATRVPGFRPKAA